MIIIRPMTIVLLYSLCNEITHCIFPRVRSGCGCNLIVTVPLRKLNKILKDTENNSIKMK